METDSLTISAKFPFETQYVDVNGEQIAYVESGDGPVVLFIHGNPTSSYLWRNVIPYVSDRHRAIALDLIGMGKSSKPDIEYTIQDHYSYVEGFVEALGLNDIILVVHDWGGAMGTMYATRNSHNVRAVAMLEHAAPPMLPMDSLEALGDPELVENFHAFRDPVMGPKLLMEDNIMVEGVIPGAIMRELGEQEMTAYRAPFPTEKSRLPAYRFTNEIPVAGEPARNVAFMGEVNEWITTSSQPKLVLYADPGMIVSPTTAEFLAGYYSNVKIQPIGAGIHFVQEDQPEAIGKALSEWIRTLDNHESSESTSLKSKARDLLLAIATGDADALKEHVSAETFVQHSQNISNGLDGLTDYLSDPANRWKDLRIKRVIQDGSFVALHSVYGVRDQMVRFDVFEFENMTVVAHWGGEQSLRGPNPSGRTMTDGPTGVTDLGSTDENRALVGSFFEGILLNGQFDTLGRYIEGDNYIQHNPDIADGMSNLFAFIQSLAEQGTPVHFTKIDRVLAEGNFVLVMSEASFGGHPTDFFDLYRVENGKIAEHWDVIQPRATASQ
ncbi:MAG: haloalkane dehalogenase [Pseudomonadota bacterium]